MDEPRPEEPRLDEVRLSDPATPDDREILGRYRVLQVISIALIGAGLLLPIVAFVLNPRILSTGDDPELVQRLLGPILLIGLGGLLLLIGLVMNAVRSLIVRAALPPERYRGPAIFVVLLLAVIIGTIASFPAVGTAVALAADAPVSVIGTLLLLISTQIGLLAVTGGLVVAPRALAGIRLAPPGRLLRTLVLGLALAVPAWIGATLLAVVASLLLEAIGVAPDNMLLDSFLEQADPTVILVAFIVIAPIGEELFFRGVVYNAWERERGATVATFGSAALFAVIHGSLYTLVPIFALGVGLAVLYRATRSLTATIAMHAGFNAISVTIALLARAGILSLPT